MSYKFILRGNKNPQTVCVTARFGRNGKLLFALPVKSDDIFWDAARGRVKTSMYCTYAESVNSVIAVVREKLDHYILTCARDGKAVTKEGMKSVLDEHFCRGTKDGSAFHAFFDAYIDECDTRMNGRRGGQIVTYKTKREYVRTYELFKGFEAEHGAVTFEDIDKEVLQQFVAYLQKLNLATNTIAHKIISLKSLLREAVERELTTNTKWMSFKHVTEETDAVALNEMELERIRRCNLRRHPRLIKIRDLFLIDCWTGLRYSDIIRLREEYIHDGMIEIRQQKTDNPVIIPLHPVVREIWERYNGIPISISNQKFNDAIKLVCKAARLREKVIHSVTKGGKKVTTIHEKWEKVSAHTARRSFATNLYLAGFPAHSIMKITGHKTEAAFLKYIKVSPHEHAQLLVEHWKKNFKG